MKEVIVLNNLQKKVILTAMILIVGGSIFLFGMFYEKHQYERDDQAEVSLAVRQSGYRFINPLLECEIGGETFNQKYIPFEASVKRKINDQVIAKENDIGISVYFRNLNNGPWFGINEGENFTPASLLKVPLAMAYFRMDEVSPGFMEKEIVFSGLDTGSFEPGYIFGEKLISGKAYPVRELVERMIKYSDNDAAALLAANIAEADLNRVYTDLGINIPKIKTVDDYMSVKNYASFFRILYNSSYLNDDNSENMLRILADSEFRQGLVAGVPKGTAVAHKFGERLIEENGVKKKQLHDCGIIYAKNYPYLLCVMTRGDDFEKLSDTIKNVSTLVWQEIEYKFGDKSGVELEAN